jgi:lipoprotein-anchoring transpeptidase ErfK/SrfK
MKKLLSSLLILTLMLALFPVGALAEETNVWGSVGPAPSQETPSNIWGEYDPAASPAPTPAAPSAPQPTPAPAGPNKGQVTSVTNEAGKLPTATQGVLLDSAYSMPYAIKVDRTNQIITIFSASEPGVYNVMEKQFICSTGTSKNETPEGVFTLPDTARKDWRYFKTYKTYVRYAVHIEGNYFFHSLLYSRPDLSTMSRTSYRKLGTPASHGCIRMLDEDVKWMAENCAAGTKVFIMDCQKDSALNKALRPPKQ